MHPGNMMWDYTKKQVVLIDFEIMGIGIGPMDLCNFIYFARPNCDWLEKYEKELVEIYYQALLESAAKADGAVCTAESYPIEQCWKDYARYGFCKVIFYAICSTAMFGNHFTEDTQEVLLYLINKHNITPENVPPLWM